MRHYSCKCGEAEFFGSDTPSPCQGCEKCKTNFYGQPLKPHKFDRVLYNQNTGKPYHICSVCYTSNLKEFKEAQKKDEET